MKRFRVEGQQLGAAQTETMAHPGECRHFGHATKLHSFKSHNTHEDRGLGGPIPVTDGTFETKVTTGGTIPRGGGGGGATNTQHGTIYGYHIYPCSGN